MKYSNEAREVIKNKIQNCVSLISVFQLIFLNDNNQQFPLKLTLSLELESLLKKHDDVIIERIRVGDNFNIMFIESTLIKKYLKTDDVPFPIDVKMTRDVLQVTSYPKKRGFLEFRCKNSKIELKWCNTYIKFRG